MWVGLSLKELSRELRGLCFVLFREEDNETKERVKS